jgi:phage tail sheath gpL-like
MPLVPIIAGFPSSNRVPGAVGEVLFGTAGQSAASLPLLLLCVGLKTSAGSITADTQVQIIASQADADAYAGAGSELACMLYDALKVAGNAGVPIYAASPTPASGATAAGELITIGGTWSTAGQITVRIGGVSIPVTVGATDTTTTVAANIAAAIAGYNGSRLPVTATSTTGQVALACRTSGQRGAQHVVVLDTTQIPAGLTATFDVTWSASTAGQSITAGSISQVTPTAAHANGYYYQATAITTGTTGSTEPTWPTTIGTTVVDSGVTWTCWGFTANSLNNVVARFLGKCTGLETYTALLATLINAQYNRIALACNDATSVAAWKSQIDGVAAAPTDLLQHYVCAVNCGTTTTSSLTAATALGQTTANDQRGQVEWAQSCETHPSRIAAATAAQRALSEQQDPDAAYNYFPMPTIAPQFNPLDWPTNAVLVSALNNSVTPLSTQRGDGFMRIVRSITSHSLSGSNPDYSTFDTGQASVPDFILTDWRLYYLSNLQPNNPRVQDNPNIAAGEKNPPSGVLYPNLVSNAFFAKLTDYSNGVLSPSSSTPNPNSGTVAPIVDAPQTGDVQSVFDPVARRIIVTANARVKANDAQLGISVRQAG